MFVVEASCAYVFSIDVLKRMVEPILAHGHKVQLHLQTEWLPWFASDPVGGRRGNDIADFALPCVCGRWAYFGRIWQCPIRQVIEVA